MVRYELSRVEAGMVLHEDVFDERGVLLLSAETVLTHAHIDFLKRKYVSAVMVKSSDFEAEMPREPVEIEDGAYEQKYALVMGRFKQLYSRFRIGSIPVYQEIDDVVEPLYEMISEDEQLVSKIWQISVYDVYTFDHSVAVSMTAALLGKWCGFDDEYCRSLALAGLLHDIGKCNIPDQILTKADPLTEEEEKVVRTHAYLGYLLVKDIEHLPYDVLLGVLQHHERIDGKGYPSGISGGEISVVSRIVSIADIFCNLTQNRHDHIRRHPFDALEYLESAMGTEVDAQFTEVFIEKIAQCFIHQMVELSDGSTGEIILIKQECPTRPLVQVANRYVDLAEHDAVSISRVF